MIPYRTMLAGVVLMFVATRVDGQSAPLDYPQWRGRNGEGSASAFTPPTTWPDALSRRWRIDVGEGYATPLVVKDIRHVALIST